MRDKLGRFIKGNNEGFQKRHIVYKGCEKGWFKKNIIPYNKKYATKEEALNVHKKQQKKWFLSHPNYKIKWRHRKGINKKYRYEQGASYTKEYKSRMNKLIRINRKKAGRISIATIQQVYEENIKQYGTLTCYLCLNPIEFSKDHLEHKTPLSRGGTNEKENLGVACSKCNARKYNKTEEEFKRAGYGLGGSCR